MDKITNKLFNGYSNGQVLTADNLNSLVEGLNNVVITKINELVDASDNQLLHIKNLYDQLNILTNRINEIKDVVDSSLENIKAESITIPQNIALCYKKDITIGGLDYESTLGSGFYVLTDHETALNFNVGVSVTEYWRIDSNGNYEDTKKHKTFLNKSEQIKILTNCAIQNSDGSESDYVIPQPNYNNATGQVGSITLTYSPHALYGEDGNVVIDENKQKKPGSIETNMNWKWNHGIVPVNPLTYTDDISGLDYVCLANVPTLYEVFSKKDTEFKNRILDDYYGGQDKVLSNWYGELSNYTGDWWWTQGNDHVRFNSTSAHNTRNVDNVDSISNTDLSLSYKYYWVTNGIYIADGATISPTVKFRYGDGQTYVNNTKWVGIPQNLDKLTTNDDLGSIGYVDKAYVAIRPRMDAILAAMHFVIPGSGWGKTNVNWEDFVENPQYYINQYLGKEYWPGPDDRNNRDKTNDIARDLYYSGAPESIWKYTGIDKNDEVYCTTGYDSGQYFYGPDQVGLTEFVNNKQEIMNQTHKTNYDCVSRMYYWNDGYILKDPYTSRTTTQYKFWVEGPAGDYQKHSLSYNQKLKPGDIFVILQNRHSKSVQVSAILGNFDLSTARIGGFTLNTGLDSQQATWSESSGYSSGFTTNKDIIGASNAITSSSGGAVEFINVPFEDIVADHHHDTQTLLSQNPQSEFLYKRYGGRDYIMYAFQISKEMSLLQLSFWPYYD